MIRKHLIFVVVIAAILMMALAFTAMKYGRPDYVSADPTRYMILEPGVGVTIEWADQTIDRAKPPADVDTSKIVYETYKVFDESGGYPEIGGVDGNVNISAENARVFLTRPDGTEKEITSELWYVPLQIYPPLAGGEYRLRFELAGGYMFERTILLPDAIQVELIPTGERRIETIPQTPHETWTAADWRRHFEIESLPRRDRELYAFRFGNLDVRDADNALHILPSNRVRGGAANDPAREFANIDEYFWLDLDLLGGAWLDSGVWDVNPNGDHLFLVKDEGQWYYAAVTMPDLWNAAGFKTRITPGDGE